MPNVAISLFVSYYIPRLRFVLFLVEFTSMKYLLSCSCGQSVEVEPSQAGQTVVCVCGATLLVPSMLQVKALPIAPEKPVSLRRHVRSPFIAGVWAALATFIPGVVCLILSIVFWSMVNVLPYSDFLFILSLGLGCALVVTAIALFLRTLIFSLLRVEETGILSRTFFVIGTVLLFPSFLLAPYLYAWKPAPRHATIKQVIFTYGSNQKPLYQDSTPISSDERVILWITDEEIDHMMPMELYFYFQTLEHPAFSYNFQDNYEAVKDTYRIWVTVNVILFILALSGIIVSFFMPRQTVVVTGWSGSDWQ